MVVPADLLGSADFRHRHGVRLAYVAGSMYRGISSPDMVVRMGRAGLLAFLGSGGLAPARLARDNEELGSGCAAPGAQPAGQFVADERAQAVAEEGERLLHTS